MSLLDSLKLDSVKTRTGFITPDPKLALLPELVHYFLTQAIQERAHVLAKPANEPPESYLHDLSNEYSQRMDKILTDELTQLKTSYPDLSFPAMVDGKFEQVYFRFELTDADFASQAAFEKVLGKVRSHFRFSGLFVALPLPPREARAIASLLLRSVQKVALQIISNDYPATAKKIIVPPSTQETITKLLRKLDQFATRLLPDPPLLKSLPRAEAELNVAIARSELRVALPVRSIPTAPLTDTDLEKHYVGRDDDDALTLARQVRHADGTILVTGYRGVGKSTFVNRVMHHVIQYQSDIPADGWLVVPITINLAKVTGVQNILRLTLRAVRNTVIDPDTGMPRPIPGFPAGAPLPLDRDKEIQPLQEAYARATYKVTMTRGNATESKFAMDGSLGFDVSKLVAPLTGFQLPSFGFKGSKSRTQSLNRSLSLLDYDENAAEEDLAQLIRNLANRRPLYRESGPEVRIKLVFIFDELDKMDLDEGLNPMIEGLKNLFLQQYAVFILVTSKTFYYHLLNQRVKEDAMLNSYFSAIVPVPLLTFDEARRMVGDWIDWPDDVRMDIENKLLDQLTRWLLYHSYDNPRDIIRELRQMQEWADTTERPYLSDRLTKSRFLQIFAGIQECIEKVARSDSEEPQDGSASNGGGLTLISERLGGDESRLEQMRRGLYILTEQLIDNETLSLKPEALKQLRENNFSQFLDSDVEQLARKLGFKLSLLHKSLPMEVFSSLNLPEPPKLFIEYDQDALRTTPEFYRLTGRQATGSDLDVKTVASAAEVTEVKDVKELVSEAEGLAKFGTWAERRSALGIIRKVGPAHLSKSLEAFLLELSTNRVESVLQRREAAKQLTHEMLFRDPARDLTALVTQETDDEMLSLFLPLLGKAADEASKTRATDAILALFKSTRLGNTGSFVITTPLKGKNAETALTVIQAVAERDVLNEVLEWLCSTTQSAEVQEATLSTLNLLSEKLNLDQADRILTNNRFLKYFVAASRPAQLAAFALGRSAASPPGKLGSLALSSSAAAYQKLLQGTPQAILAARFESHLHTLFTPKPLYYLEMLLRSGIEDDLTHVLTPLLQAAFDRTSPELARFILGVVASEDSEPATGRLLTSLPQTPESNVRMLPYLQRSYEQLGSNYSDQERKQIDEFLQKLASPNAQATPIALPPGESFSGLAEVARAASLKSSSSNLRVPFSQTSGNELGLAVMAALTTIATLLIELFLFKRDLPPDPSITRAFLSRLLLFVADFGLVWSVSRQMSSVTNSFQRQPDIRSYSSPSISTGKTDTYIYTSLMWVGLALFYVHTEYIGPLSFLNQVMLFFLNLPAGLLISKWIREKW
jgi:Cdc6-like AAA superfamily ATPase